ncbi:hypothetical protein [Brevibacillus reuszeri]|uniref:hypothetical protein n=1 Tax=Brevibacillus reuszeri TaxID=54915 RepID=UPI0028A137AB|nr:hypothetical protein [Brevibacillus reuszeri]
MPRKFVTAIAVSTLIALLLSLVPSNSWKMNDIPTFQATHPIHLSEQNTLDLFTRVETHYNIKRIKWENSSIYVDLAVNSDQKVELPHVFYDFYGLTHDLFTLTDNVKQVYFRLLEVTDTTQDSKLLVAIQSSNDNLPNPIKPLAELSDVEAYVRDTFPVRIEPYFYERISP